MADAALQSISSLHLLVDPYARAAFPRKKFSISSTDFGVFGGQLKCVPGEFDTQHSPFFVLALLGAVAQSKNFVLFNHPLHK
jgi:hypothetical protein